jgi:alkanesulfonate monooxygenase SsuD/methylene tetrahydromethanopterin reductase-like flavin-dependent oxidoreductase (luciferase family)
MKIGLFDHVEDAGRPLSTLFDERLTFAQAADEAGFYCLQLAEHHSSPLNLVPSPSVYMGALARVTRRMRIGPLVYLLPLYTPLRLIEEICMLDHLSHGRIEIGIGRGVSPYELKFHHVDHSQSREIFEDAFQCIARGLTTDQLTYKGRFYNYENVPIVLRPLQQPYPAFWYASSSATGSTFAGEQGLHFVTLGPTAAAKANIDIYRAALAKRGGPVQPKSEFKGGAAIGISRYIFVGDTDAEAHRIGKPAVERHLSHVNWLLHKHGESTFTNRLNAAFGATYEDCIAQGFVIAGTPDKVRAQIEAQVATLGINYLLAYMFLGAMSLDEALRSLSLFRTEVMPHIARL